MVLTGQLVTTELVLQCRKLRTYGNEKARKTWSAFT